MLETPLKDILRTTSRHLSRLENMGIKTADDLLSHFPRTYNDRSDVTPIRDVALGEVNTIRGIINRIFTRKTKSGKLMTMASLTDDTGTINVVWFNQPYIRRILFNGNEVIMTGKVKMAFGKTTVQSPAFELQKEEQIHSERIVPVYHETEGIKSKWIREKIKPLIDEWTKYYKDYLPQEVRERNDFLPLSQAIKHIHFPENEALLNKARERLGFDELFLLQLRALKKKWEWQQVARHEKIAIPQNIEIIKEFINNLPFKLTNAQKKTLYSILQDMEKPYPMSRLVQGDVGSGKTIVAVAAMLNAVKAGFQCAVMAPTEILAKQHYASTYSFLAPFGFNIQFISGSTTQKQKEQCIRQMKSGTIDIVIGTHALIQEKIGFNNLGLAVVDEQHRFGVKQRSVLKSFGSPHLLSLSATPIPRTLAMTLYGDQDISVIDEMPKGRQEIITRLIPEKKRIDAYRWIEDQIKKGRQVFVICPLIDESDTLGVKSVKQEYAHLKEHIFPHHEIGLLHGKLKSKEKNKIMEDFADNKIHILVSTSVVEVGIDVPNATIMLIEGAERFGLSQLHQFRGRVGRGKHQSYCFLFTGNRSPEASQRLQSMVTYSSGFKLAEIDLTLRGPGEIYGVRQSGIPDLKLASLTDSITIEKARKEAQTILEQDATLNNYPKLKQKIVELDDVYVKD